MMNPPLLRTYRDLFLNTGYELEREETLLGEREGVRLETLMSLFAKPA